MAAIDAGDMFSPQPAPPQGDAHAALIAEWTQGLARLASTRDPCPGFRTGQWLSVHAAARGSLATTAGAAAAMGWSTVALFGVHPVVGVRRVDCCGALMVSSGSPIAEVTPALIRYRNGLAYRRTPPGGPSVPVWAFGAEQDGPDARGQVIRRAQG